MAQRSRRTEAYILLVLAIAINALLVYGFVSKPIIAYHLTTPLGYNETIDFGSGDLQVGLEARNLGGSPARLDFSVRIYNMTMTSPSGLEVSPNYDFTSISIPLEGPIHASGKEEKTITVTNVRDDDYLVLIFSLETRLSLNPVEGFFSSFEAHEAERPTALLLKRVESGIYMRVTRR